MRALPTLVLLTAASLAGCARWEPQTAPGPVEFTRACPLQRAPAVADIGEAGVRAVYHFVTQDAPPEDLGAFLSAAEANEFSVMPMTVNINGEDTLFVHGPAVLHDQHEVDREFDRACGLGRGKVFLTHVQHNPHDPAAEYVRAR